MPPRIRGRTAQIETPIEDAGKWVYELSFWEITGEKQIGEPMLFGPFNSEDHAHEEGMRLVQRACETIEKEETGQTSGKYFDLKNGGVMRPWQEHS